MRRRPELLLNEMLKTLKKTRKAVFPTVFFVVVSSSYPFSDGCYSSVFKFSYWILHLSMTLTLAAVDGCFLTAFACFYLFFFCFCVCVSVCVRAMVHSLFLCPMDSTSLPQRFIMQNTRYTSAVDVLWLSIEKQRHKKKESLVSNYVIFTWKRISRESGSERHLLGQCRTRCRGIGLRAPSVGTLSNSMRSKGEEKTSSRPVCDVIGARRRRRHETPRAMTSRLGISSFFPPA